MLFYLKYLLKPAVHCIFHTFFPVIPFRIIFILSPVIRMSWNIFRLSTDWTWPTRLFMRLILLVLQIFKSRNIHQHLWQFRYFYYFIVKLILKYLIPFLGNARVCRINLETKDYSIKLTGERTPSEMIDIINRRTLYRLIGSNKKVEFFAK